MCIYAYFLLCISTLYDYDQLYIKHLSCSYFYIPLNQPLYHKFLPTVHAGDIQQDKDYMVHKPITECILVPNLYTTAVILSSRAQFRKKFGKS